ncbi:MAG: MFS transporter [Propionibacteriaceae bacterium]|jgi:MFS family permease|nr:MFS transporter [Propionibacteriaceae bacterium]
MPRTGASRFNVILACLVVVEVSSGFLQGYYEPLIPQFGRILTVGAADLTLFNGVPLLVAGLFVPLLTKLGDILGHRRLLRLGVVAILSGVVVLIFGTLIGSYALVLAGRFLMGPIAIWLPLEIAIIHPRVDQETSRRAVGLLVASVTSGTVVGMVLAGLAGDWVADLPSTERLAWAVAAPTVLLLVSLGLVLFVVPESPPATAPALDLPGVLGLSVVLLITIGAVTQLENPEGLLRFFALLALALAAGAAWYIWERRSKAPAIDVRLVFSPRLGPIYLISLLQGFVVFGTLAPFSTFATSDPAQVGYGFALGAWGVALIMASNNLLGIVGAVCFAGLARRLGVRTSLILGAVLPAGGFLVWTLEGGAVAALAAFVGLGFGYGLLSGGLPALTAQVAPASQTAIATGLYNSLGTLGGAIGNFVMKAVLASATSAGVVAAQGYRLVWLLAVGGMVAAVAAALLFQAPKSESTPPAQPDHPDPASDQADPTVAHLPKGSPA